MPKQPQGDIWPFGIFIVKRLAEPICLVNYTRIDHLKILRIALLLWQLIYIIQ